VYLLAECKPRARQVILINSNCFLIAKLQMPINQRYIRAHLIQHICIYVASFVEILLHCIVIDVKRIQLVRQSLVWAFEMSAHRTYTADRHGVSNSNDVFNNINTSN